jgi:hypothetical protein
MYPSQKAFPCPNRMVDSVIEVGSKFYYDPNFSVPADLRVMFPLIR